MKQEVPRYHEYAFDVQLYAVVRVKATTEEEARTKMDDTLSAVSLTIPEPTTGDVRITEASLTTEYVEPEVFEVDGVEV